MWSSKFTNHKLKITNHKLKITKVYFPPPPYTTRRRHHASPSGIDVITSERVSVLMGQTSIHKSFYDILSVEEDASYEEIRASYRSAIISSHPDKKVHKTYEVPVPDDKSGDKFLKVQKAWEVLSDSKSRAVYDSELRCSRQDTIAAEDVSLEDMTIEVAGEMVELFYPCRCGDFFLTNSLDFDNIGYSVLRIGNKISIARSESLSATIILPCSSCSLHIRLLINRDYEVSINGDS